MLFFIHERSQKRAISCYLGADVPRDLPEHERLRVPRAIWFLTVGGVVLGMWSFYLFVIYAYAG